MFLPICKCEKYHVSISDGGDMCTRSLSLSCMGANIVVVVVVVDDDDVVARSVVVAAFVVIPVERVRRLMLVPLDSTEFGGPQCGTTSGTGSIPYF